MIHLLLSIAVRGTIFFALFFTRQTATLETFIWIVSISKLFYLLDSSLIFSQPRNFSLCFPSYFRTFDFWLILIYEPILIPASYQYQQVVCCYGIPCRSSFYPALSCLVFPSYQHCHASCLVLSPCPQQIKMQRPGLYSFPRSKRSDGVMHPSFPMLPHPPSPGKKVFCIVLYVWSWRRKMVSPVKPYLFFTRDSTSLLLLIIPWRDISVVSLHVVIVI